MEKKDNNEIKEMRVTGCIYDRFVGMADTDNNEMTAEQKHLFAHNCALALDYIGAGKIKNGEAYDLLLRAVNNEFKDEKELLDYIAQIRAERKRRTMSAESKVKSNIRKLLKIDGITSAQIAMLLNISEAEVNEIIKTITK